MTATADALMAIFGFKRVEESEMTKKNDGGPAFPVPNDANVNGQEGMTLRDYFAAKAMQGMVSAEYGERLDHLAWSIDAYELADAMLSARDLQL